MNCNIIKDLLPSYIDGICSEETAIEVEKHIGNCVECKHYMHAMQQPTKHIIETNVEVAKEPFKRIVKKRRLQVMTAIVLTFMMTVIGYQVVQNVGAVNQFFFPKVYAIADITDDSEEWRNISFTDYNFNNQDYVVYDSLFWKKEVISDANNESDVLLRVKDEKGNVILEEFHISPGKSFKLGDLKRNKKYFFEIKAPQGRFNINAT
ncbi:MAG TPA: hypothetical protein GXX18_00085 [Bacillales bacterium]|nr:hypothetical protein [Bacillales bacterium]